ncbi:MAG: MFS transporter [Gemmataceae bacterium]
MTNLFALGGMIGPAYLTGAIPSLIEQMPPSLRCWIGSDEPEQATRVHRGFFGAWIVAMPFAGWLADESSHAAALAIGAFGMAICWALLAFKVPRRSEAFFFGGLGFFYACMTIATFATIPTLLNATDRSPEALCWGYVVVGIGMLTGPALVARIETWIGCRGTLSMMAFVSLLPMLVLIGWEEPARKTAEIDPWTDPAFWLTMAALALYFPAETCIESWVRPFLADLGYEDRRLSFRLAVFWGMFLFGRFAFGFVRTGWEGAVLAIAAFLVATILGNVRGTYQNRAGTWALWLAGLCFGPILPGLLGLLLGFYPETPGILLGVALGISGLHHAFLEPWLVEKAKRTSPREALRLPLALLLVSSVPMLLAAALNPNPQHPPTKGRDGDAHHANAEDPPPKKGKLWKFVNWLRKK